jgi:branched-subunit amino acid ABC-type transport system permease component
LGGFDVTYLNGVLVGVFTGGAYALVAVSITLMYRSTGFLSFAHAAFASLGAYIYADLAGERGYARPLAAIAAVLVTALYGLATERMLRPVRNAPAATKMIATLGIVQLTTALILLVYGFAPTSAPLLLPDDSIVIGSLRISYQQTAVLGIAAASALGLGWFLRTTRFGTAIRAVAGNPDAARLMGVSLTQVGRFNWALGAALAGATGVLLAPLAPITAATFTLLLAKALTATLVGGLVSLPLTFLGGLGVGIADSLTVLRFSAPGAKEVATLVLVVGLLIGRRRWAPEIPPTPEIKVQRSSRARDALARAGGIVGTGLRSVRWPLATAGAVLALVVPARSGYWGFVGARGLCYTIQSLSLVLLVGWGGQVSLMHGAYVGIGAFTTALLVQTHGVPLELALLGGGIAGMVMGAIAGLPALRLSGLQFAIASLAFAGAASEFLFRRTEFPKSLPRGTLFGVDIFDDSKLYLFMVPVTIVLYLVVWNVRRSTYGPLLLSSRDAGTTVAHFGADPNRTRMGTFLLASFIAAFGGGFYGVLLTGFTPFDFSLILSIALLIYAVIGGMESLAGPLVAGVAFGVIPQIIQGQASTSASAMPDLVAGVAVLALLALRPQGLASMFRSAPAAVSAEASGLVPVGRFDIVLRRRRLRPSLTAPVPAPQEATS